LSLAVWRSNQARNAAAACLSVTAVRIRGLQRYLPEAAHEALRQVAFDERRKIHNLLIEGVELALKKRGYPALADMKTKWQRKER
jgi:hypothetical protein